MLHDYLRYCEDAGWRSGSATKTFNPVLIWHGRAAKCCARLWGHTNTDARTHARLHARTPTCTHTQWVYTCMIRYDTSAEKRSTYRLPHEFILVPCRSASDLGFRGTTRRARARVLNPQPARRHHQSYCANSLRFQPIRCICAFQQD